MVLNVAFAQEQTSKKPAVWLKRPPPIERSPRPPMVACHRPAPQLSSRSLGASPRAAGRVEAIAARGVSSDVRTTVEDRCSASTQATQTTEFLQYFHQLQQTRRSTLRAERDRQELDTDVETQLLADRQVIHQLMRRRRRPMSGQPALHRHRDEAMSSGYTSAHKYDHAAYESLVGMCNSYEEQVHQMGRKISWMGPRCDKVDGFERANEHQLATHAAETANRNANHTFEMEDLMAAHSAEISRRLAEHAAEVAEEFLEQGGSESALMSTTSELEVAVGYALSPNSLLFKIRTASFMQRGADISFLSAFPAEAEFLYPPLVCATQSLPKLP